MIPDPPPLRLYTPDDDRPAPHVLAAQELLRPPAPSPSTRDPEPYSRGWFELIELKRYATAGAWLPRVLEFSRHRCESLVMLGPGLGTDAVQYHRYGTAVTVCLTPADETDAVRRNFHLRGLDIPVREVPAATALPFARGAFDLAYLNALHSEHDLPAVADELYRVLKPGGKLFALFPAHADVASWQRWLLPLSPLYWPTPPRPTTGPRKTAREVQAAFPKFGDFRFSRRHLRRAELPPPWRVLPLGLAERCAGRVLAVRAFKPIAASLLASRAA